MTERVEHLAEGVTLYLGDCREILPTLGKVDAVVTDPPYGIGDKMQGGTWGAAEKYADFRRWDIAPSAQNLALLRSLAPSVVLWGGNYFDAPAARCWLIWDKANAVRTMADVEMAWTSLDRPAKRFRGSVGVHEWGHPTEKPLDLMKWTIEQIPPPCDSNFRPLHGLRHNRRRRGQARPQIHRRGNRAKILRHRVSPYRRRAVAAGHVHRTSETTKTRDS
jgi:hypothetical protein